MQRSIDMEFSNVTAITIDSNKDVFKIEKDNVILWQKIELTPLPYEKTTGGTDTVILKPGKYKMITVGGGGAAACVLVDGNIPTSAAGGSGAKAESIVTFDQFVTLSITCGNGGSSQITLIWQTGVSGKVSTIANNGVDICKADSGSGGKVSVTSVSGGSGGTKSDCIGDTILAGNAGTAGAAIKNSKGGEPVYGSYGGGGGVTLSQYGYPPILTNGTTGYVRIENA